MRLKKKPLQVLNEIQISNYLLPHYLIKFKLTFMHVNFIKFKMNDLMKYICKNSVSFKYFLSGRVKEGRKKSKFHKIVLTNFVFNLTDLN